MKTIDDLRTTHQSCEESMKPILDHREALAACYAHAEEGNEALQEHWNELDAVLNGAIMDQLQEAQKKFEAISRCCINAFGSVEATLRAVNEFEEPDAEEAQ